MARTVLLTGTMPTIARSDLTQEESKKYMIPLTQWRVFDAMHTLLPGTAAADDLALIGGTHGSASPIIQTIDFNGLNTSASARATFQLPREYDDGQPAKIYAHAGALTATATTALTLIFDVREADSEAGVGSDLYGGAAVSINSLTPATVEFALDASGLVAGDWLDILMTIAYNAGAVTGYGFVGEVGLKLHIRG